MFCLRGYDAPVISVLQVASRSLVKSTVNHICLSQIDSLECFLWRTGAHLLEWSPFQDGIADMLVLCPLCGGYGEQKCFNCMGTTCLL